MKNLYCDSSRSSQVASIKALVAAGANKDAKDCKGRTVAEILDSVPPSNVIERLMKALSETEAEST